MRHTHPPPFCISNDLRSDDSPWQISIGGIEFLSINYCVMNFLSNKDLLDSIEWAQGYWTSLDVVITGWNNSTEAKVSDSNSFRVNQNYFDSFRHLYPSQSESFRTNPNNVLYHVSWKTVKNKSDLIWFIPRHQSEWIRTNPSSDSSKPNFQSESIRIIH